MHALVEDLRTGEVSTQEVPQPELRPGGILLRTAFSAISAGTELAKLEQGRRSLIGKAWARPDLVRQVLDFARTQGVTAAYHRVQNQLDTLSPLGYSCAGTVLAVGDGVCDFRPGDRVACAGAGYANHSEINFVPQNLAVLVPDSVPLELAAFTTMGAIAMQGLRQSGAVFGETVSVIGAGLMGVLTIQLARAAGCRVIAIDVDGQRADKATALGAHIGLSSSDPETPCAVAEFSRYGADAILITAATASSDPLELAAKIARDRARIVIVGDVGLGISRRHLYEKELSISMSRSYGPGRYDPRYEEEGADYPLGYVRWTEKRNMEAFLDLLASGALNLEALIAKQYPIENAADAYAALRNSRAYTALIKYPAQAKPYQRMADPIRQEVKPSHTTRVRVGCIGAGTFARNVVMPALKAIPDVTFQSVASASGFAAQSARERFRFARSQTPAELIQDEQNNTIFILSQDDSHAHYVVSALSQHKAVFVEKPLATSRDELSDICAAFQLELQQRHNPFLMVGFNRRFAPLTEKLREFFTGRQEPMMVNCRVNAGFIPREHWAQRQGGRIIGELCHFVDWARSVINVPIQSVYAKALPDGSRYSRDNVAVTITFSDGSVANLVYLANGDRSVPKEFFEVFCGGAVATLNDFRELTLVKNGKKRRSRGGLDKGHKRELQLTVEAIRDGNVAPIPFAEMVEVTEASFAALESIASGHPVQLTGIHCTPKNEQGGTVEFAEACNQAV